MNIYTSADIYNKIEKLMLDKDLTIYALGKRAKVPLSTIYNWRDTKSSPNLEMLRRISNALNVSTAKLFTNDTGSLTLNSDQKDLVRYFDCMDENMQKAILNLMKEMARL